MQVYRSAVAVLFAVAAAGWVLAAAGQQLPLEPLRESGQGVTPAYEGWFPNEDGTFTILVGYFNRNRAQTLEIPVGPNNRVEPGGPDQGQPTFFATRRQWGVFSINVPKDFGTKKLTWTIVANGETASIPLSLHPGYQIEPYKDRAMGNTPPVIRFEPNGKTFTGPPKGTGLTLTTTMPDPIALNFWVSDESGKAEAEGGGGRGRGGAPRPPATVTLAKHRGPGEVKFSANRPELDFKNEGRGSATATFSAPGEYVLRVQVNDSTGEGGGGFQCCWTNVHVKVTVNPAK
jgi:hypothetical protein